MFLRKTPDNMLLLMAGCVLLGWTEGSLCSSVGIQISISLLFPFEQAPDYARRIVDVVESLSEIEKRSPEEILNDLLTAEVDVVHYQQVSGDTEKGDISLASATRMLDGAKRSLLAAACSVISPVRYHPRMSLSEAVGFLEDCRFLGTEVGSFTVAIACPLRAWAGQAALFDDPKVPFSRRATELLMRSLRRLVQTIESDEMSSIIETREDEPPISANLCDALLEMRPPDGKSRLIISASWASVPSRTAPERLSEAVALPSDYFPILEDVYTTLRPSSAPTESQFVGYVDALNGNPGADGRMQGETRFVLVHKEEEVIRARSYLGPDDYQKAVEAHGAARIVVFRGVLHQGRRINQVADVRHLEILGPIPMEGS